jgi:arsenite transporter
LLLGLVVIGLMSAIGPAILGERGAFFAALAVVFLLNMPIQLIASGIVARSNPPAAPAVGITAGNRNAALFLSVLPQATADELLLFIGCFQIPMYLTPFVLARWYRRLAKS